MILSEMFPATVDTEATEVTFSFHFRPRENPRAFGSHSLIAGNDGGDVVTRMIRYARQPLLSSLDNATLTLPPLL